MHTPGYSPEPSTKPLSPPPDLTPPGTDDDTTGDQPDDEDDDEDDDQVQCWHIEPHTPCDWNICRQPERLARGDYGTDPALGLSTPNLDRIRRQAGR